MPRKTYRTKQNFKARCEDCDWQCFASNALGVAARHSDKYGHNVYVDIYSTVSFRHDNLEKFKNVKTSGI